MFRMLYKNAQVYIVYHSCLCFISDHATMAQEQKSLCAHCYKIK